MKVGIPRERHPGERRVAGTPDTVQRLVKMGFSVSVEAGAGEGASGPDAAYADAGAAIVDGAEALWAGAELILKLRPPTEDEVPLLPEGGRLICLYQPAQNEALTEALAARKATVVALDQIPRISRAQKMDVLSSMANIAGYRAVIEAANLYGSFFAGQITAAGRLRPARVLVIGAGVAGLAAVAAARGLGAEVKAFDIRPAVREQVQSLGASFLELTIDMGETETAGGYAKEVKDAILEAEHALFLAEAPDTDIIISTALIPGRPAPMLLPEAVVEAMKPGSVIVDMAAEAGGNCALTEAGAICQRHGVHLVGLTDLVSRLPGTASQLFGSNLCHLLGDLGGAGFVLDRDDVVVRKSLIMEAGEVCWPPPPDPDPPPEAAKPAPAESPPAAPVESPEGADQEAVSPAAEPAAEEAGRSVIGWQLPKLDDGAGTITRPQAIGGLALAIGMTFIGVFAPSAFVQHLTVFVLACFIGWQVVWKVTPALHTPLMSVTNAISGIIVVGGLLQASSGEYNLAAWLGAVAILVASINVAGGFLVTRRMLSMFRK